MIEKLKHKYALSDKGAKDMVRAIFAVALANLVLMMPVGYTQMLFLRANHTLTMPKKAAMASKTMNRVEYPS